MSAFNTLRIQSELHIFYILLCIFSFVFLVNFLLVYLLKIKKKHFTFLFLSCCIALSFQIPYISCFFHPHHGLEQQLGYIRNLMNVSLTWALPVMFSHLQQALQLPAWEFIYIREKIIDFKITLPSTNHLNNEGSQRLLIKLHGEKT